MRLKKKSRKIWGSYDFVMSFYLNKYFFFFSINLSLWHFEKFLSWFSKFKIIFKKIYKIFEKIFWPSMKFKLKIKNYFKLIAN